MRTGQTVGYIDASGERHTAEITAVVGTGPSLFKRLDLRYRADGEDVELEDVPHENDAEGGEGFWLEKGVQRREPVAAPTAEPRKAPTAKRPGR